MDINSTLTTVISIFLMLLVAYAARKFGAFKTGDAQVVNSLIINLTMPAYIFVSTHNKPFTISMVKAPALGFVMEMVVVLAAYVIARALKLDRPTTGTLMLVSAFGNTGFMGYPVTNAAFNGNGHAILTAVMFDTFGMAIILYTIGVAIATTFAGTKFEWSNTYQFLKTPIIAMTILALIFRKAYVPPLIMSTLTYLGNGTIPLSMISIGLSLRTGSLKNYPLPLIAATILKLVALPLLMLLTLPIIGVHGIVYKTTILESAMPSAVFTGVVASRYKANGEFAAAAIFITTLISAAWIPIVLILMR